MRRAGLFSPVVAMLALACGGGSPDGSGAGETTSGATSTTTDGTGAAPIVSSPLADGAVIDHLEVNQGVGIPVVAEGGIVPEQDRVAPVLERRPGLIRLFWKLEAGFTPREIEARITLETTGGTTRDLTQRKLLSGPPGWSSVDESYAWLLTADDLQDVASFSASLHEVEDGPERAASGQRVPPSGTAPLGVHAGPMGLRIVIVPASLACASGTLPVLLADEQAVIETQIKSTYPVDELDVTYHAPVALAPADCSDPATILAELSALREQEAVGGEAYYHAIFPNADEALLGIGGYAWIETPDPGADRVSFSVNWWGEPAEVINNLGHELGHNHGRTHTFEDAAYQPSSFEGQQCGRRDSWGFGAFAGPHAQRSYFADFAPLQNLEGWLIPPTADLGGSVSACEHFADPLLGPDLNDMMSYASPYWASGYTYDGLAAHIRAVNEWAPSGANGPTGGPRGSYFDDRSLHVISTGRGLVWQLHRGGYATPSPQSGAVARLHGNGVTDTPVSARPKIDADRRVRGWVIPLPDEDSISRLDEVELVVDGGTLGTLGGAELDRIKADAVRFRSGGAP